MLKMYAVGFLKDIFYQCLQKKQKAAMSLTCKISTIKQDLGHFLHIRTSKDITCRNNYSKLRIYSFIKNSRSSINLMELTKAIHIFCILDDTALYLHYVQGVMY